MKQVIAQQYRENVDMARRKLAGLHMPPEGWLRSTRKALGMSGAQLARRLGITRGAISNFEKAELDGGVTIKTMQQIAAAMNCRFVYAIVPEEDIEKIIDRRAQQRAHELVKKVSIQMAFENQALSSEMQQAEITRVAKELLEKRTSELWNDE